MGKWLLTTGRNNITGGILSDGLGIIDSTRRNWIIFHVMREVNGIETRVVDGLFKALCLVLRVITIGFVGKGPGAKGSA